MCAEFMIRASNQKILRGLGVVHRGDEIEWENHARLYSKAPVVVNDDEDIALMPMAFSLKPKGTPYPTFNARLLSYDEKQNKVIGIDEKPTWRDPIRKTRCLIPMSGFIEPVYLGKHAGEMVSFEPEDDDLLYCAGIYSETLDKASGELHEGFALIIHTPSEFVLKEGHHRQPLFLKGDDARQWIAKGIVKNDWALDFLLSQRYEPALRAVKWRSMAKGWEKRVSQYEKKLETERAFMMKLEGDR